ncbi:AAA family ATPase [Scatolibacter rhodanostii]|uniref:cytidylate kinase-like family protein n=1 Tax=Scatolibacter rhodanostii TaxID=2014781 RepID=UPI000C06933E|nr:cytidylate kinase-like family protein [Scatolibacter rhodanostii]
MQQFIITIARQYGSGGRTVGHMLAERLNIPYYGREIITMASEDSGINQELFSDERLKPGFFRYLMRRYQDRTPATPENTRFIESDNLYSYQAKIIRQLAEQGPCILIGRCADYILRERPDVIRVMIHAPTEFCVQQAAKLNSLPDAELRRKIAQTDDYRSKFYEYYTGQDWLNAQNYDLALNSAVLGFEGTADAIEAYLAVRKKTNI